MQNEIQNKKDESAKKGSMSPMKEHRAAIEASRLEIREKVKIKIIQVVKEEENRALRKNLVVVAPVETEEEIFARELAALEAEQFEETIVKQATNLNFALDALVEKK